VGIRTVHPDGDNTRAARAMADRLIAEGFDPADVKVIEAAPRKGNLVARLRGTGEPKPMLLLAHIDVVEAKREDWSDGLDPFTLTERGGYLYGRGTLDDKGPAALYVAALIGLKREGFGPKRDVIVALTADEEGGTHNGVQFLLNEHRALIDADFAINEGGAATLRGSSPPMFSVQVSEKMYLSFELEATNAGGHSSLPRRDNAIYDLAAALERVSRLELPARITDVARAYAANVVEGERGAMAEALRAIATGNPSLQQVSLVTTVPRFNAQLRTTCVATRLEGGHADNALPQRAKATVNCRLLPGETEAFVRSELERAAGPRVTVTATNKLYASEATDTRSPEMAAIAEVTRQAWPGAEVIPIMSAGATDGSRLRNAGIPVYGMLPIFMKGSDLLRMHGRDERIPAAAFDSARRFVERLVRRLASPP